jgi:XRE family aerobic/anaerobic benzoate catabolism transcriptional regulator
MSTQFPLGNTPGDRQTVVNAELTFLRAIGKTVRAARARRGMTRQQLADEAEISSRHLAQVEMGEGNISIVLLRRITNALNIPLGEIFADEKEPRPEQRFVQNLLERLPENSMKDIAQKLMREFGTDLRAKWSRVALIGLRGAGKSTLGAKLAKDLQAPFIEMDVEIEKDAGMPLAEIFSLYGQSGYRRMEKRTMARVLNTGGRAIISVGGGVVSEKENYDYLLSKCVTVWIKAQPEEHMGRVIAQEDFRAMADNNEAMEDLRRILEAREPLYEKADGIVNTSGESVEQSLAKLHDLILSMAKKANIR